MHDEETIRKALSVLTAAAFGDNKAFTAHVPAQRTDADLVMSDVIRELMESRKVVELARTIRYADGYDMDQQDSLDQDEMKRRIAALDALFKAIEEGPK